MKIEKKYILIAVLFFLILVILFLPTSQKKEIQEEKNIKEVKQINLKDLSEVDWGDEKAIFAQIESDGVDKQQSVKIILYNSQPNLEIFLIRGKWAGAQKYQEFKKSLEQKSTEYGFAIKEISIEDEIYPQDSIVIIPSGVWPAVLNKDLKKYFGENSIIIYLGSRENISIDLDGKITKGGLNKIIENCTKEIPTIEGKKNEEWPKVIHIKKTIDEIENISEFIEKVYETILEEQKGQIFSKKISEQNASQITIITPSLNATHAALLYYQEKKLDKIWIAQIKKYESKIFAQKNSEKGVISLQLSLKTFENQKVNFYLKILDKNLQQKTIKRIASFDGSSPYWVGSIASLKLPNSRNIIIEVIDQYGREYAKALVNSPEYKIELVSKRRNIREYCVKKNDLPIEKGRIKVKKEGGEWTDIDLLNSCFAVSSEWKEGKNTVYFKIDEYEFSDEWIEEESKWKLFVFIGIPFLIIFIIWFLFFRRERGRVFYLEVPDYTEIEQQTIKIKSSEILSTITPISSFEEIKRKLIEKIKKENGFVVTTDSIENALIDLVKEGKLRNYLDYYGLASISEKEFYYKIILKTIEEFLKRNGMILNEKMIDSKGKKWAIILEKNDLKMDRVADFLVFLDDEKREEFLNELKKELNKNSAAILLAITTKKTKIFTLRQLQKMEEYY
ncbi:MAG: hypothetical protein QXV64_01260 [Candidatus Anstonellaceae archaeon]